MTPEETAAHVAAVEADGYTIVENAIEPALIDELNETLLRLERDMKVVPAKNSFEGHRTVRIYNLLALAPVFQRIPVHGSVLPVIEGVLDEGCLVSSLSSISIDPGETGQPIHADDQVMPVGKPHAPFVCNSMWALTDFTEENGATRIIPGTHKSDSSPEYGTHYDSIPAEMPKGSVLIWHGSLWHGGGANRSSARRVGVAMNYCAGYIRQQENQQLGIPLDIVKTFAPRLRELCGFGTYRSLIGHIDKKTPAQRLLDEAREFRSIWDS
ncbi:phytanoyl-CoA dioxygenase family protein [Parvibaculum sp.]|jgi:ectoine hydroxylase-related dioxygenase (phytanoyl-CoA dioxygenase family)|uniref:phytanoyl-CoA dioxygenase family protein n=1 Tax=Parvibaculum sp. TaxID=2024848 RepID=UPI002FDB6FAA